MGSNVPEQAPFEDKTYEATGVTIVRLLVVDDFQLWRECVKTHLEEHPSVHIAGFASDGLEALQKVEELQPDLVLLDISLPKLNGIEAARQIRNRNPDCKIVFLTGYLDREIVRAALEVGGSGYVHKEDAFDELLPSVRSALVGEQYLSQSVAVLREIT